MENRNKKILTLSYLAAGAIVAFTIGKLIEAFAGIIPGFSRIASVDFVQHGLPLILGAVTFIVLQTHKRVNEFADEVVTEISKIVWPSRKDTVAMTIVVCIMVVFAGFMLGLFDAVSGYVVAQMVKIPLP